MIMTDTNNNHLSIFPFEIAANILRYSSTKDLIVIGETNSWYRTLVSLTLRERIRMSESADRQIIHVNAYTKDNSQNPSENPDSAQEVNMRGVFSRIDPGTLRLFYTIQSVIDGFAGPKDTPEPVVMEIPCAQTTDLEIMTTYAVMRSNWKQIDNYIDTDTGSVSCNTLLGQSSHSTLIGLNGGMVVHCKVNGKKTQSDTEQTPISIEFCSIEMPVGWWITNRESFINANRQMSGPEFIFW
ncbi:hypothetical protein CLU79DRAFT_175250 [Phycomyces nitens]|nr:hypothetical protein CLU79DRAFT_175250 [Phycomyces nitens]